MRRGISFRGVIIYLGDKRKNSRGQRADVCSVSKARLGPLLVVHHGLLEDRAGGVVHGELQVVHASARGE